MEALVRRIDAHLADTMAFLTPEQQHQARDRMCGAEFANWEGHVACDRNEFTMCFGMCFFPAVNCMSSWVRNALQPPARSASTVGRTGSFQDTSDAAAMHQALAVGCSQICKIFHSLLVRVHTCHAVLGPE